MTWCYYYSDIEIDPEHTARPELMDRWRQNIKKYVNGDNDPCYARLLGFRDIFDTKVISLLESFYNRNEFGISDSSVFDLIKELYIKYGVIMGRRTTFVPHANCVEREIRLFPCIKLWEDQPHPIYYCEAGSGSNTPPPVPNEYYSPAVLNIIYNDNVNPPSYEEATRYQTPPYYHSILGIERSRVARDVRRVRNINFNEYVIC